jgi:phosphatidate cytidylyltransferase
MFAVGLPLIIGMILFLPHYHHLALNILVTVFSALGAVEFAGILGKKGIALNRVEAAALGLLGPGAMTVINSFGLGGQVFSATFILGASWLLVSRVFFSTEDLKNYTNRIAAGFSLMMYPGLFMAWVVRMTILPHASGVILLFFLIVFANDSVAWAVGMLFGKGNRGIIPVSPNKSVAGFIGGIGASVLIGVGAEILLDIPFVSRVLPPSLAGICLGLCTGIAATLGDLAESAMKRSSDMKDSGAIIPGRGGVLDSIDSVALAAPVFYVLYRFLF